VIVTEIKDTGPGIPEKDLARIFDPFFTTRPPGVGTGLGLSVVKSIMDFHGGAISIGNAPEGGSCAALALKSGQKSHHGKEAHSDR